MRCRLKSLQRLVRCRWRLFNRCSQLAPLRPHPLQVFPHNVECRKGEGYYVGGFHWKALYQLRDWDQRVDKILALEGYVTQEWKLLVWHQLCLAAESFGLVLVWQHTTWGNVRCVEGHAICREALSKLRLGEGRGWRALVPCLSKYTNS